MIRRITLENYMSHVRTEIEPAAGLTVLIGPNNCGKSAVVSALMTLCGENAGDFMVRHGEKVCRITVETEDPPADGSATPTTHTVVWQRKRSAVSYVIDGREVARAGRGNLPDDLHTILRLPAVRSKVKNESYPVHFGVQKEPIFLIDSESQTAAFFSSSVEAERLLEMQRLHKEKAQSARGEKRAVEAELTAIDARLAELKPLDEIEPRLLAIEADYDLLCRESGAIATLQKTIERIEQAQSRAAQCAAIRSAYEGCCPPPPFDDPAPLASLVERIDRHASETRRQQALAAAVLPLSAPPTLHDPTPLARVVERIDRHGRSAAVHVACASAVASLQAPPLIADESALAATIGRMQSADTACALEASRVSTLSDLGAPPTPHDLQPMIALGIALRRATDRYEQARSIASALASLAGPPALTPPEPLAAAVQAVTTAGEAAARCAMAVAAADRDLADVQRRIVEFVVANPVCPTCGGEVTPDHLMRHGGIHAA